MSVLESRRSSRHFSASPPSSFNYHRGVRVSHYQLSLHTRSFHRLFRLQNTKSTNKFLCCVTDLPFVAVIFVLDSACTSHESLISAHPHFDGVRPSTLPSHCSLANCVAFLTGLLLLLHPLPFFTPRALSQRRPTYGGTPGKIFRHPLYFSRAARQTPPVPSYTASFSVPIPCTPTYSLYSLCRASSPPGGCSTHPDPHLRDDLRVAPELYSPCPPHDTNSPTERCCCYPIRSFTGQHALPLIMVGPYSPPKNRLGSPNSEEEPAPPGPNGPIVCQVSRFTYCGV